MNSRHGHPAATPDGLKLDLDFRLSPAGRTYLARQSVRYPCHLTRPFHLDDEPAGLATLFVQSASGGLYDREELTGRIRVAQGASAHVTTQASTIVHRGSGIRQAMTLEVAAGGFLAFTPDAAILFAGADFSQWTVVRCRPGAHLVLIDSVTSHDPYRQGGGLHHWRGEIEIHDGGGHAYVDRQHLKAGALVAALGPDGRYRAMASVFLLGPRYDEGVAENLRTILSPYPDIYVGVGRLPDGVILRGLAESGSALAVIHDACFAVGFESVFGCPPAKRRK